MDPREKGLGLCDLIDGQKDSRWESRRALHQVVDETCSRENGGPIVRRFGEYSPSGWRESVASQAVVGFGQM